MTNNMNAHLQRLAQARKEFEIALEARKTLEDQFKVDHAAVYAAEDAARAQLETIEAAVREAALNQFVFDNIKTCEGYTIKIRRIAKIVDYQKAFEWCLTHFTPALKIDLKKFEQAIKDNSVPGELGYVEEIPGAYIDKDLSRFE